MNDDRTEQLDAGELGSWLRGMRSALAGARDADVPCDGCVACCTSAQFVHVAPDEQAALASIPAELLVPAPGMPEGHLVMGYDERGRCPMLGDHGCTIYEHRPQTCRTYDCRVFAATGVGPGLSAVGDRVRRWRFRLPTVDDERRAAALRAADAFVAENSGTLLAERGPTTTTQVALLAVRAHEAFLAGEAPSVEEVAKHLTRRSHDLGGEGGAAAPIG